MSIWIFLEIVITIAVLSLQAGNFVSTLKKIRLISNFFPNHEFNGECIHSVGEDGKKVKLLRENPGYINEAYSKIIAAINKYLENNQGITDFAIVKNIVDRNIESIENRIGASISLPLYIGLMGTFVGIILGLAGIAVGKIDDEQGIHAFITGVVIAMGASFVGLLLTVINNVFIFKEAKAHCDGRKNEFYNFLEAELLPHLENNIHVSLEKLRDNVNLFNVVFERNMDKFDKGFGENVSNLVGSVSAISSDIGKLAETTNLQKEFITELQEIGSVKTAKANLELFVKIEKLRPNLLEFIEKQAELTESIKSTHSFVAIIDNILNRVKTFEDSINKVGEDMESRKLFGEKALANIEENMNFIDSLNKLARRHMVESVGAIEQFFKDEHATIKVLTDNIKIQTERAFNLQTGDNPFQKLMLLDSVEQSVSVIKDRVSAINEIPSIREAITKLAVEQAKMKDLVADLKDGPIQKLHLLNSLDGSVAGINNKLNHSAEVERLLKELQELNLAHAKTLSFIENIKSLFDTLLKSAQAKDEQIQKLQQLDNIGGAISHIKEKIVTTTDIENFYQQVLVLVKEQTAIKEQIKGIYTEAKSHSDYENRADPARMLLMLEAMNNSVTSIKDNLNSNAGLDKVYGELKLLRNNVAALEGSTGNLRGDTVKRNLGTSVSGNSIDAQNSVGDIGLPTNQHIITSETAISRDDNHNATGNPEVSAGNRLIEMNDRYQQSIDSEHVEHDPEKESKQDKAHGQKSGIGNALKKLFK
jgi:hypothetical protein